MKISIIIIIVLTISACSSKYTEQISHHYKKCIEQENKVNGFDFYGNLITAEELLIKNDILEGNSRNSYKKAIVKLFNGDNYKNQFLLIKKEKSIKNITSSMFSLFFTCSNFEIDNNNVGNLQNYQRILSKFRDKGYDDLELITDLFIATNFKNKAMRMHFLCVFIINLEMKYGEFNTLVPANAPSPALQRTSK